jgi:hypothetical protein
MEALLNLPGAQRLVNNMAAASDERYQPRIVFITTATAVGTAAKIATFAGYTPRVGDLIALTFTSGNTANSPTLNINSGGAIQIRTAAGQPTGANGTGAINAGANGTVLLIVGMEGTTMRFWLAGSQDLTDASWSVISEANAINPDNTAASLITGQRLRQGANAAIAAANLVPSTRNVGTTGPLTGGGNLSGDRTIGINAAAAATATAPGAAGSATYAPACSPWRDW